MYPLLVHADLELDDPVRRVVAGPPVRVEPQPVAEVLNRQCFGCPSGHVAADADHASAQLPVRVAVVNAGHELVAVHWWSSPIHRSRARSSAAWSSSARALATISSTAYSP